MSDCVHTITHHLLFPNEKLTFSQLVWAPLYSTKVAAAAVKRQKKASARPPPCYTIVAGKSWTAYYWGENMDSRV